MTYRASVRDDIDADDPTLDTGQPRSPAPPEPVGFTSIEEQVIAVARTDRLGSIEPAGWIDHLIGALFGLNPDRRFLADPRLETLRRAVVVARHRHHLPDPQAAALRRAGFSAAQVSAIETRAILP